MQKRIPTLKPIFDHHFGKYLENRKMFTDIFTSSLPCYQFF